MPEGEGCFHGNPAELRLCGALPQARFYTKNFIYFYTSMTPTLTPVAFPNQSKPYIFKGVYLDHRNEKSEQVVFVKVFKFSEDYISFTTLDFPGFLYHDTKNVDGRISDLKQRFFEGTWFEIE